MSETANRTVVRVARQLVIDLIEWEINAADGEGHFRACEEFGADRVNRALRAIADDLRRKGAEQPR